MTTNESKDLNHFDFSITSYCNAACPSCKRYPDYGHSFVDPNQKLHENLNQTHMNFSEFKKIINANIKDFKNKNVTYEGELGDPLVHPEVENFIDFGCEIFESLRVVTNGGNRRSNFYEKLGNKHKNLQMTFSIDGLYDDTNQIYRKRVNTKRAIGNMLSFNKSKYGKTFWQFLVFEHNFFEIPEVLEFSEKYKIRIYIKINQRPKFKIKKDRFFIVKKMYEKHKTEFSSFMDAN